MSTERTDPIVIIGDGTQCEEGCVSGTFQWTPGEAVQQLLEEVPAEDRMGIMHALESAAHSFLGIAAHAVMMYNLDQDGTAFHKAQDMLINTSIELSIQLGVMEMEAELANPPSPDEDFDPTT